MLHKNGKYNPECQQEESLLRPLVSSLQSAPHGKRDGLKAAEIFSDVASVLNDLSVMFYKQLL